MKEAQLRFDTPVVDVLFGFAFDVERSNTWLSGFQPAKYQWDAKNKFDTKYELFGDLRLSGLAHAYSSGFAGRLIIIGGMEARYPGENVSRPVAMREMLIRDRVVDPNWVEAWPSKPNTGGNVEVIKQAIADGTVSGTVGGISNHYHLPRIADDFAAAGMSFRLFAAEAVLMLYTIDPTIGASRTGSIEFLSEHFGGGTHAQRVALEIVGMSDKYRGTYKSTAA